MPLLNLSVDEALTTTRAVRRRLDLSRPVEPEVIQECLEIALQAPTGSYSQGWHFIVITDAEKRKAIADIYRQAHEHGPVADPQNPLPPRPRGPIMTSEPVPEGSPEAEARERNMSSVQYLGDHLHEVPVLVIPCIVGRVNGLPHDHQAAFWGSILPATWSFMLAARERGLGTAWTVVHLMREQEAAQALGIPYEQITQVALIPVAYTIGDKFKPGVRKSVERVLHWNKW